MEAPKSPFEKPDSPGTDQSAGNVPSSATGIFGQVPAAPLRTEDDLLESLLKKPMPPESNPAPAPAAPDLTIPAAGPAASASPGAAVQGPATPTAGQGEFTRMLQALNSSASAATSSAEPATRPSEELAKAFSHVALDKIQSSEPAVKSGGLPASPSSPGSFTKMFNAASGESVTPAAGQVQTAPLQPQSAQPSSGPGEFTKIFQGIKPANVPPAASAPTPKQPPPAGPGAFTRMFSNQSASSSVREDPLNSLKAIGPQESSLKFTGGAPADAEPALPAQGGFTQLLRALNQESPQKAAEPPIFQASPAPPAAAPSAGGFTQLLKALSAEPASAPEAAPSMSANSIPSSSPASPAPPIAAGPVAPPVLPPSPAAPHARTGPGEFTRIISGSALRDLQSGSGVPVPPTAPAPAAQSAWTPPSMPVASPIPAPPPAQHFAPPAFAFSPPSAPPPAVAVPAPPQTTLQKYLPLILVLNVFLMLAIVLILVFALHHK